MKLFVLVLISIRVFAADWEAVARIAVDSKIEVTTRDATRTRAI
jgi:hypothetical protein